MVEWLTGSVRELAAVILLAVALDLLAPEGSTRPYVRLAAGLLILLAVVWPLAGLLRQPLASFGAWSPAGGPLPETPGRNPGLESAQRLEAEAERLVWQAFATRLGEEAARQALAAQGVAEARATVELRQDEAGGPSPGPDRIRVVWLRVTPKPGAAASTAQAIALADRVRTQVAKGLGLRLDQVRVAVEAGP